MTLREGCLVIEGKCEVLEVTTRPADVQMIYQRSMQAQLAREAAQSQYHTMAQQAVNSPVFQSMRNAQAWYQ